MLRLLSALTPQWFLPGRFGVETTFLSSEGYETLWAFYEKFCNQSREVFTAQSNITDGALCDDCDHLKNVNDFHKSSIWNAWLGYEYASVVTVT